MRSKAIGWAVLLSLILLGSLVSLGAPGKGPLWIDIYAGCDEYYNYWNLTDENQVTLKNGDIVQIIWAGPDGAIDPPFQSVGNIWNGFPTGDDVLIQEGGIEYCVFWANVRTYGHW